MPPKFNLSLILLLLCFSHFLLGQQNEGDSFKKIANVVGDKFNDCYVKSKTKVDGCVVQMWNDVFSLMKTGDPKLNIPKGDTVIIDQIRFDQKGTAIDLRGVLTNFTWSGLSNSVCTLAKVDTKSRTTTLNLTTSFINIISGFNFDGTIVLLPIKGQGKLAVNASGISTWVKYEVVQDGTGVRISNMTLDFTFKVISIKFIQTDADPIWDAINNLVNDNADAMFNDMKSTINKVIIDRLIEYTADAFKKIPVAAFIA